MTLHPDRPGQGRGLPVVASPDTSNWRVPHSAGAAPPVPVTVGLKLPSSQHCTGEPVIGTALSGAA